MVSDFFQKFFMPNQLFPSNLQTTVGGKNVDNNGDIKKRKMNANSSIDQMVYLDWVEVRGRGERSMVKTLNGYAYVAFRLRYKSRFMLPFCQLIDGIQSIISGIHILYMCIGLIYQFEQFICIKQYSLSHCLCLTA